MTGRPPTPTPPLPIPQDLLDATTHCVTGLSLSAAEDWTRRVRRLDWPVRTTVEHLVDVLGFYTLHLVAASRDQLRVDVTCHSGLSNADVLRLLGAEGRGLATAARLVDASTLVFHFHGTTDPSGILALACSELLVHGDDACRGLGSGLAPRPDLAAKVLERLFPAAPRDTDRWTTLLWATGRASLPGHPDVGSEWTYRTTPLAC